MGGEGRGRTQLDEFEHVLTIFPDGSNALFIALRTHHQNIGRLRCK